MEHRPATKEPRAPRQPAAIDPELLAAAAEVDVSLFDLTLPLSPLERLRAATRHLQALARYRRAPPEGR